VDKSVGEADPVQHIGVGEQDPVLWSTVKQIHGSSRRRR
jgi:hypothetical protein